MSNFLAISTVTESLRQMLEAALSKDLSGGARCTAVRPMGNGTSDGLPELGANLYLYQASPNPSWRNADLPTRREDGTIIQRPRMALDLYYLLTFYGDEKRLEPQRAMGSVLGMLHARPVLTRDQIRSAVNAVDFISGSDLAEEAEQVKLTPIPLSVEELYNMWSGLFQTPYNLSMAYQASVVFVEGDETPQRALPVRARNLYVSPFRQPVIERVMSMESEDMSASADQPILAGHTLAILGNHLKGDLTMVRIGGAEVQPETAEEDRIEIALLSPPLPLHLLRAGAQGIQVVHEMMIGTPPVPHRGVESNVLAFVLRPAIMSTEVSELKRTGSLVSATLSLKVSPAIRKGQRVGLLLNEIASVPAAYSFYPKACNEDSDKVTVYIHGVKPGRYLVRIQVDGAESLLLVDSDQRSSTYNQYTGPVVIIEESINGRS
jgi:hypothetical protein